MDASVPLGARVSGGIDPYIKCVDPRGAHRGRRRVRAVPGHGLEERANLALGVWLAIFPWGLRFIGLVAAMCSAVIARVVLAVLALWTLGTDKDIGGEWSPAS